MRPHITKQKKPKHGSEGSGSLCSWTQQPPLLSVVQGCSSPHLLLNECSLPGASSRSFLQTFPFCILISLTNGTLSPNLIAYRETLPKYPRQCPKMDWTSGLVTSLGAWSWLRSKTSSLWESLLIISGETAPPVQLRQLEFGLSPVPITLAYGRVEGRKEKALGHASQLFHGGRWYLMSALVFCFYTQEWKACPKAAACLLCLVSSRGGFSSALLNCVHHSTLLGKSC